MKSKLQLKPLFYKNELVISATIICLFVTVLSVRLVLPNFKRAIRIKQDKQILTERLIKLKNKEATLGSQNAALLAQNFQKLNLILPPNKDYVLLFSTLDELQRKSGVTVNRSDFALGTVSTVSGSAKKAASKPSAELPINIEVSGDLWQTEYFLRSLSDLSGRLMTIKQLDVTVQDDGSLRTAIRGYAYFNPLPKSIGKIESPLPNLASYQTIIDKINQNLSLSSQSSDEENIPLGNPNLFD